MDGDIFIEGAKLLLEAAKEFPTLTLSILAGFGIPYHKQDGEPRLELKTLVKSFPSFRNMG